MPVEATEGDLRMALAYAAMYRTRGFHPIPSCADEKKPPGSYRDYWEDVFPEWKFNEWFGPSAPNLQMFCGWFHRLVVFDLDGEKAPGVWDSWGGVPRTWEVRSGGGGRHFWFRVPPYWRGPIASGDLWIEEGVKHSAIERLGDKKLAMAPPSLNPKDPSRRYRFVEGRDPWAIGLPAPCPARLLKMKTIEQQRKRDRPKVRISEELKLVDKIALAKHWGVRFTGRRTSQGWWECYAVDREEGNPSAAVHEESGYYRDLGPGGRKMSFLELGVERGVFRDVPEAIEELKKGKGI